MRIIGTAGHVDHGKSSLVISLTGHNPDRWAEERERGMTLDLGFAHLRFPDGVEAGIVDVPGHERFLHNMLAGAAGMDLLLLVVDASEGPRAQTREHLAILGYLNVRRAIVVLTKADLVDASGLDIAAALVRDACAGTVAANAAIVPVSNVTGFGIDALKSLIHDELAAMEPRSAEAPAFLPVDRVFALRGHGTIVTGTLMQGTIRVGDSMLLQPSGRAARVRSLQVFGHKVTAATAGSRVAVNLPGIDVESIARGEVLASPREFEPASDIVVDFAPFPAALPMLRRRTAVRVHAGSAEIPGRLVFEEWPPSNAAFIPARLLLSRPTVFYPGSRVVIRRMSPKDLLGGAIVRGAFESQMERSALADRQDVENPVATIIDASGLTPISSKQIASAANVIESAAVGAITALVEDGRVVELAKPIEFVSRSAFEAAWDRTAACLRERHSRWPWRAGCSTSEIAAACCVADALAVRLLSAWHDDGRIAQIGHAWRLPDFTPEPTKEQRSFLDRVLSGDDRGPLVPASFEAVVRAADSAKIAGLRDALESLVSTGALVRIGDDLYRRSQIESARTILSEVVNQNHGGATMSQLRDALGTSRKFALPLMEHFDGMGVTIRDGDVRRLRVTTKM